MKIYRGTYPRSSELYHHGILGQKWGVRRFQNPDGSLTAEGRERYGSGNSESASQKFRTGARHVGNAIGKAAKATGKAVGKAAVSTGKYAVKKVKQRHPSLMTDQELYEYSNRMRTIKNIKDIRRELRSPQFGNVGKVIGDIFSSGAKTLADAGFRKLASEMTKSAYEKEVAELETKNRRLELLQKNKNLNEDWKENKNHIGPDEKTRLERENELLRLRNTNKELNDTEYNNLKRSNDMLGLRAKEKEYNEKLSGKAVANADWAFRVFANPFAYSTDDLSKATGIVKAAKDAGLNTNALIQEAQNRAGQEFVESWLENLSDNI